MHNTTMSTAVASPTNVTYAELDHVFQVFNRHLFGGQLPLPMLTLQRKNRTMGYFSSKRFGHRTGHHTDELALNPAYFGIVPLVEIFQTIVHEMVHLWQAHFGKPGRGKYHNEEWAQKMEAIGLMPSSTGKPGGLRTGDHIADYPILEGPFLRACEVLLTQAATISWFDRVPPSDGFAGGHHDAVHQTLAPAVAEAALAIAIPPQPAEPREHGGLGSQDLQSAPLPVNKSNRAKYACRCEKPNQVWGKPGLRLQCLECAQPFAEVAPV
jgi:hypothetical protein